MLPVMYTGITYGFVKKHYTLELIDNIRMIGREVARGFSPDAIAHDSML